MTVNFSFLTTDFKMFETCELLSWYLPGCNVAVNNVFCHVQAIQMLSIDTVKTITQAGEKVQTLNPSKLRSHKLEPLHQKTNVLICAFIFAP